MRLTIEGLQRAMRANQQMVAALRPGGALERAVIFVTTEAERHKVAITHVDTGAYRAATRMTIEPGALRGTIFIEPSAVNPHGQRPAIYGPAEEARGGGHASFRRTVEERGESLLEQAGRMVLRSLP